MVAKAIAQSIPSLPYALMSGADVFPMGEYCDIPANRVSRFLQVSLVAIIDHEHKLSRTCRIMAASHMGQQ